MADPLSRILHVAWGDGPGAADGARRLPQLETELRAEGARPRPPARAPARPPRPRARGEVSLRPLE